jgi:glycine oxidase
MVKRKSELDAIVIGGGVMGLGVARALASSGRRVLVLERGRCGQEASRAAAGMLSPLGEELSPDPFLELGLRSLSLYRDYVRSLEAESGLDVGYRESGKLEVGFADSESAHLQELVTRQRAAGFPVEFMERAALLELEPALARSRAAAGAWIPTDHIVDNRKLASALRVACEIQEVTIREGCPATGILVQGGRVAGVEAGDGLVFRAPWIVLAAGAWSGGLPGLPRRIPVRPVRGQMLSIAMDPPPFRRVIATSSVYLVPRPDHLIVGATSEEAGFRRETTAAGQAQLAAGLIQALPEAGTLPIRERWIGFRPATPDGLPILGADPHVQGLVYATGHFRNGILLLPVTVDLVGGLLEQTSPPPHEAFRPDRFDS